MDSAEFDKFASEYRLLHQENIAASGETPEYFAEYKMRDLSRLLRDDPAGFETGRFLDFGAGVGTSVPFFRKYFTSASLTCLDVSMESLEIGMTDSAGEADFVTFDGTHFPFADAVFDCAFAACVFHHIAPEEHEGLLIEMRRVLRPGGRVFIYEHNPLNPLTVRTVNACPFDKNAILIHARALKMRLRAAGFRDSHIKYRVFFPRALRRLRRMEEWLGWLPLGAQYYVWGIR